MSASNTPLELPEAAMPQPSVNALAAPHVALLVSGADALRLGVSVRDNTATIVVTFSDFERFLENCGNPVKYVTV